MRKQVFGLFETFLGASMCALLLVNGCGGGGGGTSGGGGAVSFSSGGGGIALDPGGTSTTTTTTTGSTGTTSTGSTGSTTSTGSTSSGGTTSANPFTRASLFVDPNSFAAKQIVTYNSAGDTTDAAEVNKIATQATASWADGGDGTVPSGVVNYIQQMQQQGKTPFLVVYQIPQRDCGGLAAGGASSAANYQSWIAGLVRALGTTKAVVILEPDALAGMDCLSTADQTTRLSLISDAVTSLKNQGSAVYIDAGNPAWKDATTMATRLNKANIQAADGFALNVSNFCYTSACQTYGDAVSAQVGGKHFIIDTSRNGNGPAASGAWCNPSGRALGPQPTTSTSDPLCDAYEWVKYPGTSDGACNGGPSWGWWPSYALGLCQSASY